MTYRKLIVVQKDTSIIIALTSLNQLCTYRTVSIHRNNDNRVPLQHPATTPQRCIYQHRGGVHSGNQHNYENTNKSFHQLSLVKEITAAAMKIPPPKALSQCHIVATAVTTTDNNTKQPFIVNQTDDNQSQQSRQQLNTTA
ncbi:unnamed protein product [Rotaria sp. Silwood1]|nr:unnamed protein product [Rotaria sp. Silwood1]